MVLPAALEQLDHPAEWDPRVLRDPLVLLVPLAIVGRQDRKDCLEVPDSRDSRVTLDQVDQLVFLGRLVVAVVSETLVQPALLEIPAPLEAPDSLVSKVLQAQVFPARKPLDQLVAQGGLVPLG